MVYCVFLRVLTCSSKFEFYKPQSERLSSSFPFLSFVCCFMCSLGHRAHHSVSISAICCHFGSASKRMLVLVPESTFQVPLPCCADTADLWRTPSGNRMRRMHWNTHVLSLERVAVSFQPHKTVPQLLRAFNSTKLKNTDLSECLLQCLNKEPGNSVVMNPVASVLSIFQRAEILL